MTLRQWFREAGIPSTRLLYDRERVLADLQTMTRKEVCRKYGCSPNWVSRLARKAGIPGAPRKRYDHAQILEDLKTMTRKEVCEKHGCAYTVVCRLANRKP